MYYKTNDITFNVLHFKSSLEHIIILLQYFVTTKLCRTNIVLKLWQKIFMYALYSCANIKPCELSSL